MTDHTDAEREHDPSAYPRPAERPRHMSRRPTVMTAQA